MESTDLDLAGLTEADSGLLRNIGSSELIVPKVRLDDRGESLLYDLSVTKKVQPGPEMLDTFLRLCREPAERIEHFARTWGCLLLSSSGRPCSPAPPIAYTEPIRTWRYFSARAQGFLNLAAKLTLGRRSTESDWAPLTGLADIIGEEGIRFLRDESIELAVIAERGHVWRTSSPTLSRQRRDLISYEATLWLKLGRIGFFNDGKGALKIDIHGCAFSALALQLAMVIAGARRLFVCSGCGATYPRKQKAPKPGQENFCPSCGRKAALRKADERRREKIARARQLTEQGTGLTEIARELNTTVKTLKGWLRK
jgi:hypothetical protein